MSEEAVKNEEVSDPVVPIFSGKQIPFMQTESIMRASPTAVVVLAGAGESGKSTFLSVIYNLFLQGCFEGELEFAGSDTLLGFEEICHESRTTSGRSTSRTGRTQINWEMRCLHLKVKKPGESILGFLFSDISGEVFEHAKNSREECQRLDILKRADHIVLFVDGERLKIADAAHLAAHGPQDLLAMILDSNMTGSKVHIDVIFNKCDLWYGNKEVMPIYHNAITAFKEKFSSRVASLTFNVLAPRPANKRKVPTVAASTSRLLDGWYRKGLGPETGIPT